MVYMFNYWFGSHIAVPRRSINKYMTHIIRCPHKGSRWIWAADPTEGGVIKIKNRTRRCTRPLAASVSVTGSACGHSRQYPPSPHVPPSLHVSVLSLMSVKVCFYTPNPHMLPCGVR
jgi:hypothetical protein